MEKIHSPFLYRLFECCGGDYKEFVVEINSQIEDRIEECYKRVERAIESREKGDHGQNVTQKKFRDFVENMEKCMKKMNNKDTRQPQYCMFEFYRHIVTLESSLRFKKESYNISETDIDFIKRFESVCWNFYARGSAAINEKRLRDILKRVKESRALTNKQEKMFSFLLNECFPNYADEQGYLIEKIKAKQWEKIAFGQAEHESIAKEGIQDSEYEKVKGLFDELIGISKTDVPKIKQILIKISELLDDIYRLKDDINDTVWNEDKENLSVQEPVEKVQASDLHSHIMAFMRWVPMISQNKTDGKVMEALDNIIEKIQEQFNEIIESNVNLKKCIQTYPANVQDSIFIQAGSMDLRRLLIEAISHEASAYKVFGSFYKLDI